MATLVAVPAVSRAVPMSRGAGRVSRTGAQVDVAFIAHELRAPLTVLTACLGLLKGGAAPESEQAQRLLQISEQAVQSLQELTGDLLFAGQADTGTLGVSPAPTELLPLVDKAIEWLGLRGRANSVRLHHPPVVPKVHADPRRIDQVMTNLIENAAKYSPDNAPIDVTVDVGPWDIVVSVHDHGAGLPAEELERVFEPFYRAPTSTRVCVRGVGLGLSICRAIIEAHHGRIWAESAGLEHGSTFRFTLPRADSVRSGSGAARSCGM